MPSTKYVAYYRVSTARQGRSGLGLDAQRAAVRAHVGDARVLTEVVEIESGTRSDRPQLGEALRLCRLHRAVLVIAKLDRLARNVAVVSALMESGVDFVAVDYPAANRLTIHILAAVAEHEARMVSERTRAALQAARARGTRLGRRPGEGGIITDAHRARAAGAVRDRADDRARLVAGVISAIRADGITTATGIAAELRRREIPTPRGGQWSGVQVARVEARLVAAS